MALAVDAYAARSRIHSRAKSISMAAPVDQLPRSILSVMNGVCLSDCCASSLRQADLLLKVCAPAGVSTENAGRLGPKLPYIGSNERITAGRGSCSSPAAASVSPGAISPPVPAPSAPGAASPPAMLEAGSCQISSLHGSPHGSEHPPCNASCRRRQGLSRSCTPATSLAAIGLCGMPWH